MFEERYVKWQRAIHNLNNIPKGEKLENQVANEKGYLHSGDP